MLILIVAACNAALQLTRLAHFERFQIAKTNTSGTSPTTRTVQSSETLYTILKITKRTKRQLIIIDFLIIGVGLWDRENHFLKKEFHKGGQWNFSDFFPGRRPPESLISLVRPSKQQCFRALDLYQRDLKPIRTNVFLQDFLLLHIDLLEISSDKQIVATKIIKNYKTTI